jgi:putative tricarboxylic transport membrane protein
MHEPSADEAPGPATNRMMDIIVALLLIGGAAIVIFDSVRLGTGWQDGVGPAPGYFPFWIAVVLGASSLMTLINAVLDKSDEANETFVSSPALMRVIAILLPTTLYVWTIGGGLGLPGLGIFLSSAMFIAAFMAVMDDGLPIKSLALRLLLAVIMLAVAAAVFAGFMWVLKNVGDVPVWRYKVPVAFLAALATLLIPVPTAFWRLIFVGPAVSTLLFVLFEKWFLTPLPKGPLEAFLGLS